MSVEEAADHWLWQSAIYLVFALWILMFGIKRYLASFGRSVRWQDGVSQVKQLGDLAKSDPDAASNALLLRRILVGGLVLWIFVAIALLATELGVLDLQ